MDRDFDEIDKFLHRKRISHSGHVFAGKPGHFAGVFGPCHTFASGQGQSAHFCGRFPSSFVPCDVPRVGIGGGDLCQVACLEMMFAAFAIEGFAEVERLLPCPELDFNCPTGTVDRGKLACFRFLSAELG